MQDFGTLGVVIGRFQTDELTKGHRTVLYNAYNNNDTLLVLVGVRPTPLNATNPLPFLAIEQVIKEEFEYAIVVPVEDNYDDGVWSEQVDAIIQVLSQKKKVTLYHGRDSFNEQYNGKYDVVKVDGGCDDISATERRNEIAQEIENDYAWRRGVIWAYKNMQPRIYHTVDMACIRMVEDVPYILLAQKPNNPLWRFPGGFVEQGEKFAHAAGREFYEETGLTTVDGFKIVDDFLIDDWRIRGQEGVSQKTVLCIGYYLSGKAVPQDDICNVEWFNLHYVRNKPGMMVPEHRGEMIESVCKYLEKTGATIKEERYYLTMDHK